MELIDLNVKQRQETGKGAARRLRSNNAIPAIIYGAKADPLMVSLETSDFKRIIRENGTTGLFFNLKVEGESGQDRVAMLKDVQMDTFGLNYVHIDLHQIDMDTNVTVSIPVVTEGESLGVKEGGLLQIIRRELDVVCKPKDTPESVVIDISDLDVGDAVHVEDIDLGEAVEIPHEVNFTIITVVPPTTTVDEDAEEDEELLEEGEVEASAEEPAEAAEE